MNTDDLELFATTVRLGSFTAAAKVLDLPRSNVSRRIGKLEEELGVKLFYRTTRQLSLTKHGKSYLKEINKILAILERAKQTNLDISNAPKGKVKIGLLPETDESISPILFSFLDKYPDIELDIRSISNGFTDIYQQDLDLSFYTGEIIDSNIVARNIFDLDGEIVASPEYIDRFGFVEKVEDLTKRNCICYRLPNGQTNNCWCINEKKILVSGNITSNSVGLIKRSLLNSLGIGFLPKIIISAELNDGRLLSVLPKNVSLRQQQKLWLLYPEAKSISRATRLLIEYLTDEVPKIR